MYKQIETDPIAFINPDGNAFAPVATMADEYGGRLQIGTDDHCYILYLLQKDGTYKPITHIFKEAFNLLIKLPQPK